MKKIIFLICLIILFAGGMVLAQDGGLTEAGKTSGLVDTKISEQGKTGGIPIVAGYILGQVIVYLGIVFFLLIVYSGFLWMTASGDEGKIEKAKQILIAAVSGLVIVLSAYVIVNFVFGSVLG